MLNHRRSSGGGGTDLLHRRRAQVSQTVRDAGVAGRAGDGALAVGVEQPGAAGGGERQRHRHRAAQEGRARGPGSPTDPHFGQEGPVIKGRPVAPQGDLVLAAALDVVENAAGQAFRGQFPHVLDAVAAPRQPLRRGSGRPLNRGQRRDVFEFSLSCPLMSLQCMSCESRSLRPSIVTQISSGLHVDSAKSSDDDLVISSTYGYSGTDLYGGRPARRPVVRLSDCIQLHAGRSGARQSHAGEPRPSGLGRPHVRPAGRMDKRRRPHHPGRRPDLRLAGFRPAAAPGRPTATRPQ